MPRSAGDGKQLYVTRKKMRPRLFSESEWKGIFEQSQILPPRSPFPQRLRADLNDAINAYTRHGPNSLDARAVNDLVAKVRAWLNRTDKVTSELSRSPRHRATGSSARRRRQSIKNVLDKHFDHSRFLADRLTIDDLAFMMDGSVKLGEAILHRVIKTSARRIEAIDFWLIWGALVVSILRKHNVKFARRTKAGAVRQQFRPEVIDFIYFLQQNLPHLEWARSEPASIGKALRLVLPYARKENIEALKRILKLWSGGEFHAYEHQRLIPDLHGIHFQTKRILLRFDESKDRLRSLNKKAPKNSNSDSSKIF
jgi:hypothetical protein